MDFYFGGIGKGNSWALMSDTPIVVWRKDPPEMIALNSIEEAKQYEDSDDNTQLYVWSAGVWQKVSFVVLKNRSSKGIGFKPD